MSGIHKLERFGAAPVILVAWIALIPRILPDRGSDRGIFVSTAERLLAGDRLYSGVFDNKEPLFYYFVEAQRALGWGAEFLAEVILLLLAAAAIYAMVIKVTGQRTAILISLLAGPIVLTGGYYNSGHTELFGIVFVLVGIAAAFNERPLLAGSSIGLLIFAKMIYVPIALAGVGCVLLAHQRLRDVFPMAIAGCASALCVVGILILRGEFWPFVETIRLNVTYSQMLTGDRRGIAALIEHLRRVGGPELAGQIILLCLVNVMAVLQFVFGGRTRDGLAIVMASASVLLASVGVLAITGLWDQHGQILYLPALIGLLGLAPLFALVEGKARFLTLLMIVLCAAMLGGSLSLSRYVRSVRDFRSSLAQIRSLPPETQRLLESGDSGVYARLGGNDDLGHAIGLKGWHLACPRFHQYPFLPKEVLDGVRDCARKVPVLILAASFKAKEQASPQWNEFVAEIERMVSGYRCDADTGLRVCHSIPG
jgi:hypothetical protein